MAYSPATGVTNTNLPSTIATYYSKAAYEQLTANLAFRDMVHEEQIPAKSGKTIQIFAYDLTPFTANVSAGSTPTAATEGAVGTGLTPTQSKVTATLGQYVDFISVSDFSIEVAIDPFLANLAKAMGYRAGLLLDTLILNEFNTLATANVDGTTVYQVPDGSYLTANVIRAQVQSLANKNARQFADSTFHGVINPLVMGDLVNDNTANGVIDIMKRNADWQKQINQGFMDGNHAQGFEWYGVKWTSSTNTPSFANTPSAGKTSWGTYIAGYQAVALASLGGTMLPKERNFNVDVRQFQPSVADPAGVVGGAVAFNFKTVVAAPPRSVNTFKQILSETALS